MSCLLARHNLALPMLSLFLRSLPIFDTLYLLTSFGHETPERLAALDPPDDFFRIRLVGCPHSIQLWTLNKVLFDRDSRSQIMKRRLAKRLHKQVWLYTRSSNTAHTKTKRFPNLRVDNVFACDFHKHP